MTNAMRLGIEESEGKKVIAFLKGGGEIEGMVVKIMTGSGERGAEKTLVLDGALKAPSPSGETFGRALVDCDDVSCVVFYETEFAL